MSKLIERLSQDLALPQNDLIYLIRSAPYRYKVYEVPKKTPGKKRTIAQPAREVKPLQYWVMKHVLAAFPVHPAATAYRKGKNILDNAVPHAAHRYLCKLDFRNFFPSIKAEDFVRFLRRNPLASVWTEEELQYLSRILFWRKKRENRLQLSIGAPSSPVLSNILLYEFDLRVQSLCAVYEVTYTRYADDLTFSTNRRDVLQKFETEVSKICRQIRSPKLTLNAEKTVRASKKGQRRVTGLVLANDGAVSLGRDKKREIRASVHRLVIGSLNEKEAAELGGLLSFVKSVEPAFLQRLALKYGAPAISKLLRSRRSSETE